MTFQAITAHATVTRQGAAHHSATARRALCGARGGSTVVTGTSL